MKKPGFRTMRTVRLSGRDPDPLKPNAVLPGGSQTSGATKIREGGSLEGTGMCQQESSRTFGCDAISSASEVHFSVTP